MPDEPAPDTPAPSEEPSASTTTRLPERVDHDFTVDGIVCARQGERLTISSKGNYENELTALWLSLFFVPIIAYILPIMVFNSSTFDDQSVIVNWLIATTILTGCYMFPLWMYVRSAKTRYFFTFDSANRTFLGDTLPMEPFAHLISVHVQRWTWPTGLYISSKRPASWLFPCYVVTVEAVEEKPEPLLPFLARFTGPRRSTYKLVLLEYHDDAERIAAEIADIAGIEIKKDFL
jgi:hypothetical protein